MKLNIVWSPEAEEDFEAILDYLDHHFGEKTVNKFLAETAEVLDKITSFPNLFAASDQARAIRKAVITKQVSLLYNVGLFEIELLHFWDNRQDPKRMAEPLR